MANYLIALKTDSSGKKFLQVLSSNGGVNEFMAIKGGTPVTQHGELVAPMEISSEQLNALLVAIEGKLPVLDYGNMPVSVQQCVDGKLPVTSEQLPAALVDGKLPVTDDQLAAIIAQFPATLGQKAMAASLSVVLASDQSPVPVTIQGVNNDIVSEAFGLDSAGDVASADPVCLTGITVTQAGKVNITDHTGNPIMVIDESVPIGTTFPFYGAYYDSVRKENFFGPPANSAALIIFYKLVTP